MKLIIQIPCLNEEETLPSVLSDLPQAIDGLTAIETLIIDDGSSDRTVEVARSLGVNHIVRHPQNRGLAKAFQSGLEACLSLGADFIVNTDGDHQYPGHAIPDLVAPLLAHEADIVIGDRQIELIDHFSPVKKRFSALGNWVVRNVSGTDVRDSVSGFRAYTRDAALRLNILTQFSYTLDTLIQAGKQGLTVLSIPIATNNPTRPSRLQRNMWHFIKAQAATILRLYVFYEPLRTFSYIAAPFLLSGIFLIARFLTVWIFTGADRFSQSVSIGSGLFVAGMLIFLVGVQADIASKHRQLTQELLYQFKKKNLAGDEENQPNIGKLDRL
ncbi:MAG: glycosyltransferase family 2 protein [Ardenticatenaceae bacterium]|nr:glycosyltransferase family 2 protein [Ardenticatenaceae bacterium]